MTQPTLYATRQWLRDLGLGSVKLAYHSTLPIALISLNHSAKHNALTGKMMAEFADCIDTLEEHKTKLGALILNGVAPSFCSGLAKLIEKRKDLHFVHQHLNTSESAQRLSLFMQDTLSRMHHLPCISLSAIEGNAIGGGAELTLATDFRIITYGSMLQFVHFKLGATTIFGGATRLERLLGYPKALQLLLSCKKLDGDACYKLGLAQWLSKSGDALRTCLDIVTGYLDVPLDSETLSASTMDQVFSDHATWLPNGCLTTIARKLPSLHALKSNVHSSYQLKKEELSFEQERERLAWCWGSEQHLKSVKTSL